MTLRAIARSLDVLGRSVSFTVAALSAVLAVGWAYYVIWNYPNPLNPARSDAAQILLFDTLRLVGAVWVMWSALKKDAVYLLIALLVVGVGSFFGLFDFYIMIMGFMTPEDDFISLVNTPFLLAICELLYIVAGLVVGCALVFSRVSARLGNDSP